MAHEDTSYGSCSTSHFRYPLFTATYCMVFLVGLPLNAFSLWSLIHRLGLRSVPVIYMVNLALSDLLFTLSLPLRIVYFARGLWTFGSVACMIPGTLFSVNLYSSSFFITFISMDRMLAVVYPLRSRPFRTLSISWAACMVVWAGIIGLSVPVALNHDSNWDSNCSVYRCFEHYSQESWHNGFIILCIITLVGICIPFGIILGCTIAIVKKLRDKSRPLSELTQETGLNRSRIVRLFLVNLFIYAVCFIPFHVAFILYGLHKLNHLEYNFFDVQTVTMCLASTNSCLDPLIYYFSSMSVQRKRQMEMTECRTIQT
ncbi:lysophosphatidic acid receptor 5a [Engraulis encrasicolus]|uniref:lysophosphatidic acid receptor 5a n=1 Tax=Engraulis encrasicolus TaxID=184585 RepID=UPI002FD21308